MSPLGLGVDLGSSGLRLALVDGAGREIALHSGAYPSSFEDPLGWRDGLIHLLSRVPHSLRSDVRSIAIDGTSGTLLVCRPDGSLLGGSLARALPYHLACPEQAATAVDLVGENSHGLRSPAASPSGSLARALRLFELAETTGIQYPLLLRHQADWLMGWLLGDWRWGEEGNNLKLGWDPLRRSWLGRIAQQAWKTALPRICPSGTVLGPLAREPAWSLGLPEHCQVVAGTTDANAGVLAADPGEGDGITVLGTTLVLKQFVAEPAGGPGLSCHRVAGRWLLGGASNAGAGILRRFFDDSQMKELSRQIDPERPSGLELMPLPRPGERFPVDDPHLQPRLGPRSVSDALYLQGLLESLTAIEAAGWCRLREIGAPALRRVITLGGGARNPQWRRMRERALGVPVLNRPGLAAALGVANLAIRSLDPSSERSPLGSRMG